MVDDLERACAQVGRFMYHFAQLENQIDVAFAKLFELDTSYAKIITGSVDFSKKYNMVLIATLDQMKEKERGRVKKTLNKVTEHNDNRQVAAHSRFEPEGDGVRFTRVVTKRGKVDVPDERWSKQKFDQNYKAMTKAG
jgi:hypothetical protein